MSTDVEVWQPPEHWERDRTAARGGEQQNLDDEIAEHLERYEKWRKAYELHAAGVPYRSIGQALGVAASTARGYCRSYVESWTPSPRIEEIRNRQLADLDLLRRRLIQEATQNKVPWAVTTGAFLKVLQEEARLIRRDLVPLPDDFASMSIEELEAIALGEGRSG